MRCRRVVVLVTALPRADDQWPRVSSEEWKDIGEIKPAQALLDNLFQYCYGPTNKRGHSTKSVNIECSSDAHTNKTARANQYCVQREVIQSAITITSYSITVSDWSVKSLNSQHVSGEIGA